VFHTHIRYQLAEEKRCKTYGPARCHNVLDCHVNKDGRTLQTVVASGQRDVSVTRGDARHGNSARPNEVVLVEVLIHHVHSKQGHLWESNLESEGLLPLRVEPCRGDEDRNESWQDHRDANDLDLVKDGQQ